MPKTPIKRKKFNGSISILLEQRLKTLSQNTGRTMSSLLDEAVEELLRIHTKKGGITMVDKLKPTETTHVLCLANYKGGVGKTIAAAELAYLFAKKGGKQVLIIDADGQANITERMGCTADEENSIDTCLRAAMDKAPLQVEPYITTTQYKGVDIITGSTAIGQDYFQTEMSAYRSRTGKNPYQRIVDAVKETKRYDIIIIDTHPAADNEIRYPMQASTDILCPATPDNDGVKGALSAYAQLLESREATPELRYLGVFFNKVDPRTTQAKEYIPSARDGFPDAIYEISGGEEKGYVFDAVIRSSADVGKAINFNCAACDRFHGKTIAKDFEKLYDEVVKRLG